MGQGDALVQYTLTDCIHTVQIERQLSAMSGMVLDLVQPVEIPRRRIVRRKLSVRPNDGHHVIRDRIVR